MNNAQNSDIFLENSMIEDSPPVLSSTSYKMLLTKILEFLSTDSINKEPSFTQKFTACLEDCREYVCQCLALISSSVRSTQIQSVELQKYLVDAVVLLQKMSCFLKNLIESVALSCENLKSFPTTTGLIILDIFTHCKDSENLYGSHFNIVKTELHELFSTCYEMRHLYLIILEKHFIFDMMDNEQQNILLKALDINLKISNISHTLDVKTTAEQLKAYTGLCSKYCDSLMDKDVYNNCKEFLCDLIVKNLKTAFENDQEEKIVVRSLKFASFVIKLLFQMSDIFKHGQRNNYDNVLQTLIYICTCDGVIRSGMLHKPAQYIRLVNLLILNTTQGLLPQLLLDKRFIDCFLQCDIRKVSEDKQQGFIILLISTIKCCLQNTQNIIVPKNKLIDYVLNIIPYCQVWLNSKLKEDEGQNLEDNLLKHIVGLAMCLSADEFATVERVLCEAVLGDSASRAVFATRYWVLLARLMDPQYTVPTVASLCIKYVNLTNTCKNSPQEIQLGQTIRQLFEILPNHNKMTIKKKFEVVDKYYSLWSFIKIKNLPDNTRVAIQESMFEKLSIELNKLTNCQHYTEIDMRQLVNLIKVASTCSFTELNSNIIDCVVKAWLKACPKNNLSLPLNIHNGNYWYYSYIEALVLLTNDIIEKFVYFETVLTVLHILSNLILTKNNELILLLIPLYSKISLHFFSVDSNFSIDQNTYETFTHILLETGYVVQQYALVELLKYTEEPNFKNIVEKIIKTSPELQKIWQQSDKRNIKELNKQWMLFADCTYTHKCMENKIPEESDKTVLKKKNEMDDIFFSHKMIEEPARKKVKLIDEPARDIVKRLENDSLLLFNTKHVSDNCKKRITVVCDRLRNII